MCVYCFKDDDYYFYRRRRRVCGICVLMYYCITYAHTVKKNQKNLHSISERNTTTKNWPCVDPETLSREKKE